MRTFIVSNPIVLILILSGIMLTSCNQEKFNGYEIIEKKFIKELNADCYLLEHIKSGARVLKIAADDPNKTFSIAFSTIPVSDAGTPHIMEHSVLNGSKKFPVKSPFDELRKGSLNTFLNAMTSDDYTVYPVASINEKDYFNLMDVYLDAVFNPRIYEDERIFMQEGWHYELTDKNTPLEYKGVVYNEMKGAFSNPEREMWYQIQKNLFPENGYRFSSGGYPTAIPTLTYDDFLAFHKKNYHPCNSYIFLYGDADLRKELEFIDREYLRHFSKAVPPEKTPMNKPFNTIKDTTAYYPVIEGAPTENQTYLALNWVIGTGADPALTMSLDILSDVLVNQESAPVRKALQEAGIGSDVYAVNQPMLQNVFSIVVQNANPSDKEKFKKVVIETLNRVVKEKIDRETLQGSINRMEFRLREGNDAQKGLTNNMRCLATWIYTDNPFTPLEYEKNLDFVKQSLTGTLLEDIVQRELIENKYALIIDLQPKNGLESENLDRVNKELSSAKQKMSETELEEVVKKTKELIDFQQSTDSPENLATIPLLKLSDMNREAMWFEPVKKEVSAVPHLYFNEFTNGIVYMNFWFDLRTVPEEKLSYAALLTQLLGKMDAGSYTFGQLDNALNIHTGGYSATLSAFLPEHDDSRLMPEIKIQMKATTEKIDKAISLLGDILSDTKLENKDRLYELLKRHQAQLESAVNQNGYGVAATRLESYYSRRGVFAEKSRGMDYYWFITDLTRNFSNNSDAIVGELKNIYNVLFSKENMIAGITCGEEEFGKYADSFHAFADRLPQNQTVQSDWKLDPSPKNEGILTASKVQYVLQGFDYRKLGLTWDGRWLVLNQIMSTDWLQTRVRVIGGAYGGFSSVSRNGTIYMASYRDPNLKETLDNFRGTVDYLAKFEADSATMIRYIIGTIAELDYPLTPSQKGDLAFRWYFEGVTREEVQTDRDAVLATTAGDIRMMTGAISKIVDQQVYCVYGNDIKVSENKSLFKNLVKLQR